MALIYYCLSCVTYIYCHQVKIQTLFILSTQFIYVTNMSHKK
jgi:hypothetical protein